MSDNQEKLKKVLEAISASLKADGGDVELISFEKGIVSLAFKGACLGCPMAAITFKEFVEKEIKTQMPEVKEIKLV